MRSRSPLALMEQVVMVLVFALAAAVCVQAFALADRISRHNEATDRAVQLCQTAAETLKASGGDLQAAQRAAAVRMGGAVDDGLWYVFYDENWSPGAAPDAAAYTLQVRAAQMQAGGPVKADVRVVSLEAGNELFSLTAAWQEVSGNGQ